MKLRLSQELTKSMNLFDRNDGSNEILIPQIYVVLRVFPNFIWEYFMIDLAVFT